MFFGGFENLGLCKSSPLEGLGESNSMEEKLPFGFYYPVIRGGPYEPASISWKVRDLVFFLWFTLVLDP